MLYALGCVALALLSLALLPAALRGARDTGILRAAAVIARIALWLIVFGSITAAGAAAAYYIEARNPLMPIIIVVLAVVYGVIVATSVVSPSFRRQMIVELQRPSAPPQPKQKTKPAHAALAAYLSGVLIIGITSEQIRSGTGTTVVFVAIAVPLAALGAVDIVQRIARAARRRS